MRLHGPCPLGRVNDQGTHSLWPVLRIFGPDDSSHSGDLRCSCARRPREDERPLSWPKMRRQETQIGDGVIVCRSIRSNVAALADDVRLNRPWKVTDVVLQGDKSPGGAIGDHPFHVGSSIADLSVHAPTVSAFHAWAGSWTASTSLRPR